VEATAPRLEALFLWQVHSSAHHTGSSRDKPRAGGASSTSASHGWSRDVGGARSIVLAFLVCAHCLCFYGGRGRMSCVSEVMWRWDSVFIAGAWRTSGRDQGKTTRVSLHHDAAFSLTSATFPSRP